MRGAASGIYHTGKGFLWAGKKLIDKLKTGFRQNEIKNNFTGKKIRRIRRFRRDKIKKPIILKIN